MSTQQNQSKRGAYKKLDEEIVRELINSNLTVGELSKKFNIAKQTVSSIRKRGQVTKPQYEDIEVYILEQLKKVRCNFDDSSALKKDIQSIVKREEPYLASINKKFKGSLKWVNKFVERAQKMLKEVSYEDLSTRSHSPDGSVEINNNFQTPSLFSDQQSCESYPIHFLPITLNHDEIFQQFQQVDLSPFDEDIDHYFTNSF